MAKPQYRVQCCTYNGHLGLSSSPGSPDLASWLSPTLSPSSTSSVGVDPPDVIAIGFQELIPLYLSLAGLTGTALDLHDRELRDAIEKWGGGGQETYTLMAKEVLGGIALLVYTRDATVTQRVQSVRVATAGTGVFRVMGNKGAVSVRITLGDDDNQGSQSKPETLADGHPSRNDAAATVLTFVTAHLAAHDSGLQRRNEDWQAIVQRLVFTRTQSSEKYTSKQFPASSTAEGVPESQIYDTSHLFVFGDLNYRISVKTPKPLPLHLISHKMANDLDSLFLHDQLTQERSGNRTLHHLKEGPIDFQPTYKYIVGSVDEFKKFSSRVPGWCDRVLYATWADKDAETEGASVELYRSVMKFTQSDHKPVTAIFTLPKASSSLRPLRLPYTAPFAIDPLWRQKQLVGLVIDRTVGFFWCIVMLAGFGKDARLGITTLGFAAAAWWLRAALFNM